ncbi:hypothetical protein TWF569_001630 [Orbilia oligospora]|nr:hypothetical protein TWF569_001630 [Orbilia oligospora]
MPVIQRADRLDPVLPSCGMISLFLHQVEESPSQLAYVDATEDVVVTYSGLLAKVKFLASTLRKREIPFESPIAILAAKGINQIIAQLAVVFVGGTCVPLDPSISDDQIQVRLDDAQPVYLISDVENQHRQLGGVPKVTVSHENLDSPSSTGEAKDCIPTPTYPETRSHIFYTSGTTGKPKGVQVLARGLYRVKRWAKMRPHDLVGHVTNPTFDISTLDIWVALMSGATIVNFTKDILSSPFTFSEALKLSRVSWMVITTGLFNIVAFACPDAFSSVEILVTGGEAANSMAMKLVLENGPPGKLINAYGPTECAVWCTYHEVTLEEATSGCVSIGGPIVGTDLYVLNDDLQLVDGKLETIGELCVGGPCLSPGYFKRPDLTEKAFVNVTGLVKDGGPKRVYRTGDLVRYKERGMLEYIGRKDNQIKIHGFRVELEGIEATIIKHCAVSTTAVLKIHPPQSEPEQSAFLLAYIVLKPEEAGTLQAVSDKLKEVLPWYSIPRLRIIDQLPLNTSAKVDRKKLVELYYSSLETPSETNPKSNLERLRSIWLQTLSQPPSTIKPNDNCFSLGCTSLQSATLILKIRKEFGVALTTDALYQHQTLSAMAEYIGRDHSTEKDFDTKECMQKDALLSEGLEPLSGPIPDWRSEAEGNVFVTGATGFLGAYLVHALIQMPETKKVQCLVRAKSIDHGMSRLLGAFAKYGISIGKHEEPFLSKIVILPGDLAEPNLGLDQATFEDISNSCATIFHFGALVNYVQPYNVHRPANIIGTLNIIRLAVTGRPKPIHYSSSFVAHGPTGLFKGPLTLSEDEPLEPHLEGLMYDLGYSQSQWSAEQLLWNSIKKGIPISIYRPGFILGHSESGYGNPDDFMGRFIISCIKMGTYPLLPKQRKEFIPVDHCIRDILHISYSNSNLGRAYTIVPLDPSASVEWNDTFELLKQCGNFKLQGFPYMEWISQLPETVDERLQPLMPMFKEKVYGDKTRWEVWENMAIYQTDNTRAAIADSQNPEGCSPLNERLLRLYLQGWFEQTGNSQLMKCPLNVSAQNRNAPHFDAKRNGAYVAHPKYNTNNKLEAFGRNTKPEDWFSGLCVAVPITMRERSWSRALGWVREGSFGIVLT